MKKLFALLLVAGSAFAADKWPEAYNRGVAAINAKNYKAGADALQKAIAENPQEGTAVRTGKLIMTYVPHFWLGIARFNLGDTDGALREWRISEEQGAIARTEYYARMKDWVARAQTEKQRSAQSEASGPKKAADGAISKALAMQVNALSAGADRSDKYRSATRKLQEAMTQFRGAGTDIVTYKTAELTAQQAASLFAAAADDAKKQKAAKKPQVVEIVVPVAPPTVAEKTPEPEPVQSPAAQQPDVQSEAKVAASIAVQDLRKNAPREAEKLRKQLDAAKSDAELERIREAAVAKKAPEVTIAITPDDLRAAWRAYATGDLAGAERMLTQSIGTRATAEAYLLRGCTRYTRAMLSRTPDTLLASATKDFRAALDRNRALRLDETAFSPKLVAFFEQVRGRR